MSETTAESPRGVHVAAYGAVGDGTTDDGPAFAKAMAALVEIDGPAVLKLGVGKTYRIATLPGAPGERQPASRRGFVFPFVRTADKVLEGNGSHLILRFPLRLLSISNSERITVRGFSFTYDPLPFTQGYIQAVDPDARTLDVKVEPGFPLPTFDAPEVQDHSRAWHFCWTFQPSCHVWTKTIKAIDAKHSAAGIFHVFARKDVPVGLLMNGSRRIVVPTLGTVDGVPQCSSGTHSGISGSRDVLLEDIHQHISPHFSFVITCNTGKVELRNVDIRPPEGSGRWLASWRDGFHVKTNRGPIIVEDCDMAWLRDDCINISAIALTVEKQLGPKTYQFRVRNREGFPTIQPGFNVEGWNTVTGRHCGAARVVSVRAGDGKGYWNTILELDRQLGNVIPDGESTSFWCQEYINANSVIRNNRFDGSVRFRSPGLYENNLVTEFMIVKPDDNECPLTHDMVFRGNRLPATGIKTTFCVYRGEGPINLPPIGEYGAPDRLVRNIRFENNTLGRSIHMFDADNVTVTGNKLLPELDGKKALTMRNPGNVSTDFPDGVVERLPAHSKHMQRVQDLYEELKTVTDGKSRIPAVTERIGLRDLGAVGDGKTDDGPAFARAMKIANDGGGNCIIELEPDKVYRIRPTEGGEMVTYAIKLDSISNVIFDGRGSELVLTYPVKFISVHGCTNVWIGNLTKTYDPYPCAQTRLLKKHVDILALDLELEPGFSLPHFDSPDADEPHGKWAFCWGIKPNAHIWTQFIKEIDRESSEKGVFRVFIEKPPRGKIGGLKIGQRILVPTLHNGARVSGPHSSISSNNNVVLYGVTSHAGNHFGYHIIHNTGPVIFKRCQIRPRELPGCPTEQVFACWRDGLHIKQNMGPIAVQDCYFEGTYDDCIGCSHIGMTIDKIIDPTTYLIRVANYEGYPTIKPGFTLEAWNWQTGKYGGAVTITESLPGNSTGVNPRSGRLYWNRIVKVDNPLQNIEGYESGSTGLGNLFWIKEYGNWVIMTGNEFKATFRSRAPGIYENNVFHERAWTIDPGRHSSSGTPFSQEMIFRNNVLKESEALLSFQAPFRKGLDVKDVDVMCHDIVFTGNTVERPIAFLNARNVLIEGNRFARDAGKRPPVVINNCRRVTVGDNLANGERLGPDQILGQFEVLNTPESEIKRR